METKNNCQKRKCRVCLREMDRPNGFFETKGGRLGWAPFRIEESEWIEEFMGMDVFDTLCHFCSTNIKHYAVQHIRFFRVKPPGEIDDVYRDFYGTAKTKEFWKWACCDLLAGRLKMEAMKG